MHKKILWLFVFALNITNVIASNVNPDNINSFQQFDNQFNLGYGFTQGELVNGSNASAQNSSQYVNLEAERLFDMGLWFDINFNMVTKYDQPNLGALNGGNGGSSPGNAFGQDPVMYSLSAKIGYAFNPIPNKLQLLPYGLIGRSSNWATSTIVANGFEPVSQDFFYMGGLGGRISYLVNNHIMLYADELYSYYWDNAGAIKSIQTAEYGKSYAATNYQFTSTLGAKFNLYKDFQITTSVFWNNFQPQSNIASVVYTPTNTFGELVSLGLTY